MYLEKHPKLLLSFLLVVLPTKLEEVTIQVLPLGPLLVLLHGDVQQFAWVDALASASIERARRINPGLGLVLVEAFQCDHLPLGFWPRRYLLFLRHRYCYYDIESQFHLYRLRAEESAFCATKVTG